jgi:hypothetical protein
MAFSLILKRRSSRETANRPPAILRWTRLLSEGFIEGAMVRRGNTLRCRLRLVDPDGFVILVAKRDLVFPGALGSARRADIPG